MTLLTFDSTDFSGDAEFLCPFCFTLFILLVVSICMNTFLSIIMMIVLIVLEKVSMMMIKKYFHLYPKYFYFLSMYTNIFSERLHCSPCAFFLFNLTDL